VPIMFILEMLPELIDVFANAGDYSVHGLPSTQTLVIEALEGSSNMHNPQLEFILHTAFERQRETKSIPLVKCISMAFEVGCRTLTNRVCSDAVWPVGGNRFPAARHRPTARRHAGLDYGSFKSMIYTDYLILIDSCVILMHDETHQVARGRAVEHMQNFPAGIASPEKELYDPRTQKSIRAHDNHV